MNRKWLVPLLVVIALLVWGHNLFRVIEKTRSTGLGATEETNPLQVNADEFKTSRTLSFRYSNPFRKGPEPEKRTSRKKTTTRKEIPSKPQVPPRPPWRFLGFSDNAGVVQLSDGALIVVREGENVENWTVAGIDPSGCRIRHKDGHVYSFSLEKE